MTAILYGDGNIDKHKRFLPFCLLLVSVIAAYELRSLLIVKPRIAIIIPALFSLIVIQWVVHNEIYNEWQPTMVRFAERGPISCVFFLIVPIAVIIEFLAFDDANYRSVGSTLFALIYLGLPAICLMQIRYLDNVPATLALAATIFVPKLGDVGAYFTGSLLGKHKMAPTLSPKKTWEGFAGGLLAAILTAVAIQYIGPEPLFRHGLLHAALFGLVVGLAGVAGDLFESALKRRAGAKDASQSIPGFGGILDVIDSVLFAAPVAYLFFVL